MEIKERTPEEKIRELPDGNIITVGSERAFLSVLFLDMQLFRNMPGETSIHCQFALRISAAKEIAPCAWILCR